MVPTIETDGVCLPAIAVAVARRTGDAGVRRSSRGRCDGHSLLRRPNGDSCYRRSGIALMVSSATSSRRNERVAVHMNLFIRLLRGSASGVNGVVFVFDDACAESCGRVDRPWRFTARQRAQRCAERGSQRAPIDIGSRPIQGRRGDGRAQHAQITPRAAPVLVAA